MEESSVRLEDEGVKHVRVLKNRTARIAIYLYMYLGSLAYTGLLR